MDLGSIIDFFVCFGFGLWCLEFILDFMKQENFQKRNEQEPHRQTTPLNPSYEDIAAARRISFSDLRNHLTGPVVSVIAHIILLAICFTFVVSVPEERNEIAVEIKELYVKNIEKLPAPPPEERFEIEDKAQVDGPPASNVSAAVDNASIAPSTFSGTSELGVGFSDAPDVPMSSMLSIAPSNSPLVLPGVMAGRSKGGIKTALQKYNRGSGATERSVSKGLNWLKEHQSADGSWGETSKAPALTALATLAFLAHGETPGSQEYGSCVLKAIRKLIEYGNTSDANGLIKNSGKEYGHAMVAYALSEAYALTKIPMIEEPMNRTISRIIAGQNSLGSFNYLFNNAPYKDTGKPRCDLSLAGWNYQALKAAFSAGASSKGIEAAIDSGVKAIQKVHYTGEGFAYKSANGKGGGGTPSMTSVGVLCLQLLGAGKSKEALSGLKYIETTENGAWMKCDWQAAKNNSLYRWYYQTQALFQGYSGTGGNWDAWNMEFQKALMKEQEADGHWSSPSEKYGKGGMETGRGGQDKNLKDAKDDDDNDGTSQHGSFASAGNMDLYVYSTALCCLMLEVYYRYLPTFKVSSHDADGETPVKKAAQMDELKIE
jgi:hypothetical protein